MIRKLSIPEESPRVMASSFQLDTSAHAERHYAVTEIAEMWNLSPDKVASFSSMSLVCLCSESEVHATRDGMLRCGFLAQCWNVFIIVFHRSRASGRRVPRC